VSASGVVQAPTVRTLLLGSEDVAVSDALAQSADRGGVGTGVGRAMGGLGAAGRQAVCDEVGHVADSLLTLDLSSLLVNGWRKHADLQAAGRRTVENPGSEEVVQLATHTIKASYRPCVDVYVDEVLVTRVDLELAVAFTITGMLAVVRAGRLVEVRSGQCDASSSLLCERVPVAARRASFTVPGVLRLGEGVVLWSHDLERQASSG
jgi:hypothetical protein